MSEQHEPTEEFVSNLEWQLRTTLTRGNRFSGPVRSRSGGRMNVVVLVLASALLGAGGVVVKDEVQESKAQEVLEAKVDAELKMAALELDFLERRLQEIGTQYQVGLIGEEPFLSARAEVSEAEGRVVRLQLDLEEVRVSGKEPQNQMSAPLFDGRDFVSERLALEVSAAQARVRLAQLRLGRIQELHRIGAISMREVTQGVLAHQEAETRVTGLQERLDLRQRFLDEELTGEEAEVYLELSETEAEVDLLRMALQDAGVRYQEIEKRAGMGVVHESELTRARLDLMQLQTQLEFLEIKLQALRGGEMAP
jgi:hypothetical protein